MFEFLDFGISVYTNSNQAPEALASLPPCSNSNYQNNNHLVGNCQYRNVNSSYMHGIHNG